MTDKYILEDEDDYFPVHFLKRYMIGINGIISGGCFKNIFKKEKVKDIDIFFRNENDFNEAVEKYEEKFIERYRNKNVIAFYDENKDITIELIKKKFYKKPEQLLNEFDFTITKFAYYFKSYDDLDGNWYYDYYVIYHNKFFEHLLNNKLVIEEPNLLYPFSTFERSLRYTQYGYNLCRQSKINLLMCIRNTENFDENDLSRSLYAGLD